MRQLPRSFRERRMAAGPLPGVRRPVRPERSGTHSLRAEERSARAGRSFRSSCPMRSPTLPADLTGRLHLAAQAITDPANPRFARRSSIDLWKRYLGLGAVRAGRRLSPRRAGQPSGVARLAGARLRGARLRSEAHDSPDPHQPHVSASLRSAAGRPFRRRPRRISPRYFRSPGCGG